MENNLLIAIFVVLMATVALVPLAKWLGLGTILGFLTAGVLIGPYGLGIITDSDLIRHIAEYGVVMMMFLIGLELHPRELWRMRHKLVGLGATQLVATTLIIMCISILLGMSWQVSLIIGLALSMSSTAIAMQSIAQRGITNTKTGRGSLAVLLVQDIAVIPILALVPLLAVSGHLSSTTSELGHSAPLTQDNWLVAVQIIGAFAFTILIGRYVLNPIMRFVARSNVREAFTALSLAIVLGAAMLMQLFGLSPALGAFMGGVLLADSEYRHELEITIEPFKGLLLGLFFISVGTSIAFSVLIAQPFTILGLVIGLVAIKALILFLLTNLFKMHIADRFLLAFMLSQSGEFAFVVLQFAQNAGSIAKADADILTFVVASSMAITPLLLFIFDRFIAKRTVSTQPLMPENIDAKDNKVLLLGYGRFGQIIARLLQNQGFSLTLIDDDPTQIELVKRFGIKVFFGDASRLEVLRAAGAGETELIIISVPGAPRVLEITKLLQIHFPNAKIAARATDRAHALDLISAGVTVWERETFQSALALGVKSLSTLGYTTERATELGAAFERHDMNILQEFQHIRENDGYSGLGSHENEMLQEVMRADQQEILEHDTKAK